MFVVTCYSGTGYVLRNASPSDVRASQGLTPLDVTAAHGSRPVQPGTALNGLAQHRRGGCSQDTGSSRWTMLLPAGLGAAQKQALCVVARVPAATTGVQCGGSRAQSRRSDQVQALHSHEGRVMLHCSTHPEVTRREEALSSVVTDGTWLVRPVVV